MRYAACSPRRCRATLPRRGSYLATPDNRAFKVFSLGAKPGLANGVRIQGAKIVRRSGAGGTYYELQDYQPAA